MVFARIEMIIYPTMM